MYNSYIQAVFAEENILCSWCQQLILGEVVSTVAIEMVSPPVIWTLSKLGA